MLVVTTAVTGGATCRSRVGQAAAAELLSVRAAGGSIGRTLARALRPKSLGSDRRMTFFHAEAT